MHPNIEAVPIDPTSTQGVQLQEIPVFIEEALPREEVLA
ncbi:MAG: hypothetical protein ACI815_000913 [Psychroserpens sp.]|jgi:hypothetical protein